MKQRSVQGAIGRKHDLNRVRAIALDTNAFPYGQLNITSLRSLTKRAAAHGAVEIWVPEVALWEWAEHAAAQRQIAFTALDAIRLTGLTLPALTMMSKHDVLSQLESAVAAIGAPIRIIPVQGVAAEAIRDQIMVTGPSKTVTAKDGRAIKTGAADSALLRSLLAYSSDDTGSFVLVSSDGDVTRAFENWKLAVPTIFKHIKIAAETVFDAVPTDSQVQESCLQLLVGLVDNEGLGRLGGDIVNDLDDDDYMGEVANEESFAEEGRQVVGLSDVLVDRDGGFASGTAHLLATVTASGVVQDSSGDSTVTRWSESIGASVRIPVTFELEGSQPTAVTIEAGEGVASRPDPEEYLAAEDAWQDLVSCLGALPGAADFEWDEPSKAERVLALPGGELRLEFSGDVFDAWELTATDGAGLNATVACTWLNDGLSDGEGLRIESHYALSTDVDVGFARLNPAWAINAAVIGPPETDWFAVQDPHA